MKMSVGGIGMFQRKIGKFLTGEIHKKWGSKLGHAKTYGS